MNQSQNPNLPAPGQSDHGYDALRYWAASRPAPSPVTPEDRALRALLASLDADATVLYQAQQARATATVQGRQPEPVKDVVAPKRGGRTPGLTPWRR